MSHLVLLLLSFLAFGALALSMKRQQGNVLGRRLSPRATLCLRLCGWSVLALALFAAVRSQGWALGLVSYCGHASLAAGLAFAALIANERRKASRG